MQDLYSYQFLSRERFSSQLEGKAALGKTDDMCQCVGKVFCS